ncbi:MAG: putative membrane protein [Circular genetic element sp.]|nr:MAG: putative membrane protein [Circular genetic element sp.]
MFNPLEYKHDIASRPLKWMMKEVNDSGKLITDEEMLVMAFTGFVTAGINLFPAASLIQSGVRGERIFSHVTYARFNPWAKPIFHYTTAASKAERIGAAVGRPVGRALAGAFHPVTPHLLYKASKGAWKGAGAKAGAKLGARVGGRLIPGVGWALLAYDVYDIAYNQSLWGFDF